MSTKIRKLTMRDLEAVKEVSATIWEGKDYVPLVFQRWAEDKNDFVLGLFLDDELVGIVNLEVMSGTGIGWVVGLRVKEGHRGKGYALKLVERVVQLAKERQIETLWYATGSLNDASIAVAERLGFHLAARVGYMKLERPYPAHPKPSLAFNPIVVGPERLCELIQVNPDLIDVDRIPIAWTFDYKNLDGLKRLGVDTDYKVVISDEGMATALYCRRIVGDESRKRAAYTVFATDRSVFVDIMSRIVDELEHSDVDAAAFFFGPRTKEWSKWLGYANREQDDRAFLLFELNF